MNISNNPEDYKFKGYAQKADPEGTPYWTWLGPIAVPLEVDTQDEATKADDIMWQSWAWCAKGDREKVDTNHDYLPNGVMIVESFRARPCDADFKPGSWIARGLTFDPKIGEKVDSGEYNAWSWAGPVDRQLALARVNHAITGSGTTEKADAGPYPEHSHEVEKLEFKDDGKIKPTRTRETFKHAHDITGTTRTDKTEGHSHPLLIKPRG